MMTTGIDTGFATEK